MSAGRFLHLSTPLYVLHFLQVKRRPKIPGDEKGWWADTRASMITLEWLACVRGNAADASLLGPED